MVDLIEDLAKVIILIALIFLAMLLLLSWFGPTPTPAPMKVGAVFDCTRSGGYRWIQDTSRNIWVSGAGHWINELDMHKYIATDAGRACDFHPAGN